MKRSLIALGVAAAMGGFAGQASAQIADNLQFNPSGVGHILIVPYFSTQSSNVTALSITNTDTVNGKALKVRFRGASNSDDVFDFQVFLSPGDVWTAGISRDASGVSRLDTADKSCTLPANVNRTFITSRLPANATPDVANETREGYVEIFNMGDIVDTSGNYKDLFDAVKHVDGVPDCTSSVLTAITQENSSTYLSEPTTGLMANWFIVNVDKVLVYSGEAAAIEARVGSTTPPTPGLGNIVYWDQRSTALSPAQANANTADPLLRGATPVVAGARYDLPDLSTPYTSGAATPFEQAYALSASIATLEAAGEYFNLASLGASTDWVVTFPSRRYYAAVRYTGTGAPAIVRNASSDGNIYFTAGNTELGSASNGGRPYQICSKLGTQALGFYDREETPTLTDDIVISPGTPEALSLCGEVSVVGINGTTADASATFATVARKNVQTGFTEGWGFINTSLANGAAGLPLLARQFTRISNTITNQFYGISFQARAVEVGDPGAFPGTPIP